MNNQNKNNRQNINAINDINILFTFYSHLYDAIIMILCNYKYLSL